MWQIGEMTRGTGGREAVKAGPDANSDHSAARGIVALTLADLRRSVAVGRPMSLPNTLRLCQRRLAAAGVVRDVDVVLRFTADLYRRRQPFRVGKR